MLPRCTADLVLRYCPALPRRKLAPGWLRERARLRHNGGSNSCRHPRMLIRPRQPFDFHRTLRFILGPPAQASGRKFEPLLDHFEEDEYRRVVELDGEQVLYGVREEGHALRARILAGPSSLEVLTAVRQLVERQFSVSL